RASPRWRPAQPPASARVRINRAMVVLVTAAGYTDRAAKPARASPVVPGHAVDRSGSSRRPGDPFGVAALGPPQPFLGPGPWPRRPQRPPGPHQPGPPRPSPLRLAGGGGRRGTAVGRPAGQPGERALRAFSLPLAQRRAPFSALGLAVRVLSGGDEDR